MGVTKAYRIKTRNGELFATNLADYLNIFPSPPKREEILQGRFHKVTVSDSQGEITIEKPFLYTDLGRNELILVKRPSERYTWQEEQERYPMHHLHR